MKSKKLWDWVVYNQEFKWKIIEYCMSSKKNYFFLGYNIKMLEITIDNCHKCNLETIVETNNSQYFWISRRQV